MRRLRDKLLVAFVPLIVALIGATLVVQQRVVNDLSDQIRKKLAGEYDSLEAFRKTSFKRLSGQVAQVNLGQAFTVVVGDYFRHKRALQQAEKAGDPKRTAELRQNIADDLSTIRLDVGKEEAMSARLNLLAIVDLDGHMVVSLRGDDDLSDHSDVDGKVSLTTDPLVKEALDEARQGKSGALRSFMLYPDGELYAVAVSPLLINGYLEGVLLAGTSDYSTITEGHAALLAAANKVIAGSPRLDDLRPLFETQFIPSWTPPPVKPPWQDKEKFHPSVIAFTLNDREYYAAPCPLWEFGSDQPIGWVFFIEPLDTLLGPVIAARRRVMWVGSSILVAAILGILFLASRITRPLENLQRKMRQVGQGQLDQQATVTGNDEVAHLAQAFNVMVDGLREKERLSAYVPEKARDAIAGVKGRTALGAKRVKGSILFSDLRGFTTLSEKLDPTEVVAMLNEYLDHMQRIISEGGGYISDYIGDAIVAVFNDDESAKGSALVAVETALKMQRQLAFLRAESTNKNLQTLHMGIGINSGFLVEGDMGPQARLKYAVLGDTVNTAARIQDLSKEGRHSCILVSGDTYAIIQALFDADFMGDRVLKGKSAPVPIWEIIGTRDAAKPEARSAAEQGDLVK